jgi:hypothetical protein
MRSTYFPLLLALLSYGQSVTPEPDTVGESQQDVNMTKYILWPASQQPIDKTEYASWYANSGIIKFVPEDKLPRVDDNAKVDIFFLTKPVFSLVGKSTGVWHGGLGLRVENGPSYLFEYTSLDFEAALVYPDRNASTKVDDLLHWPALAIVNYQTDPTGKTFPEIGGAWKETYHVGKTTGGAFNAFSEWAYGYAVNHSRYLVWDLIEAGTEQPLLRSRQCFDFVFNGISLLKAQEGTDITVSELPRTVVNLYVSAVETLAYNATIGKFFSSEKKCLEEFMELSERLPHIPFEKRSTQWYWPAWYSTTTYAGGTDRMLETVDYPKTYQRYVLAWPKKTKSRMGLYRANVSIFDVDAKHNVFLV